MFAKVLALIAIAALFAQPWTASSTVHHPHSRRARVVRNLTVNELTLVDQDGLPKIRLSARSSQPVLQMLGPDGKVALKVTLDGTGHPSIVMSNPDAGSSASLAVDTKGAHVKFDHPTGASGYFFLNDEGVSGIVLLDRTGKRRYELLLNDDGTLTTGRLDDAGNTIH